MKTLIILIVGLLSVGCGKTKLQQEVLRDSIIGEYEFKDENGKNQLCHTLNGSALALPRIFASLIENNQIDGGIKIPKALQKYTGFEIIE